MIGRGAENLKNITIVAVPVILIESAASFFLAGEEGCETEPWVTIKKPNA
jgi:hypothetical protein